MDDAEFAVMRIKGLLEAQEAEIANLLANEAPDEAVVQEAKRWRDNYAQCLNMLTGPAIQNGRKRQRCW